MVEWQINERKCIGLCANSNAILSFCESSSEAKVAPKLQGAKKMEYSGRRSGKCACCASGCSMGNGYGNGTDKQLLVDELKICKSN